MSWTEVRATLERVPDDWAPWIDLFRSHGFENTLQVDSPPSVTACVVEVPGSSEEIEALKADLLSAGAVEVHTGPYEEVDWEAAWKQFFNPRKVGKNFVVRPTWEEFEAGPEDRVIVLDPGQAFGTGDHATTRMCLRLLEAEALAGARVLDVGCGSGILSIAAKLLGASEVVAVDIDPVAVEVTRENAALNTVDIQVEVSDGVPHQASYDLVLSNIISAALIRFAPDAAVTVRPGGKWIVSGVLQANWPDVRKAAEQAGLTFETKLEEDDWVAATFHR